MSKYEKRDLYQDVTNAIIQQLEQGTAPWVKPWSATPGLNVPCNAITNRPYSGINLVLLWMAIQTYPTPRFLTYRQAQEAGGNVKKGEHGIHIVFVKPMVWKDKDDDTKTRHGSMLKSYVVFNVAQCENLPERILKPGKPAKPRNHDLRDPTIDEFIRATKADVRELHTDRACYKLAQDTVEMPKFEGFKSADHFFATLFHELGHWTGAGHRCNREFGKRFGDHRYAAEELVAELTSAFLCAEFDLDGQLQHAAYIANWIQMLKDDKRAFFTAASKAQQAADYLRGKALAEDEPTALAA